MELELSKFGSGTRDDRNRFARTCNGCMAVLLSFYTEVQLRNMDTTGQCTPQQVYRRKLSEFGTLSRLWQFWQGDKTAVTIEARCSPLEPITPNRLQQLP